MIDFKFKELFLELTKTTIPFGNEDKLYPILSKYSPILMIDSVGNYYTKIGKSDTLFTCHLDTYSKKYEKINHIIDGNIIKTDGTTILGGDNKNGVVIMLYMITQKIPGTYYFFVGEEGIVTGISCNGSTDILQLNSDHFKKYKRAIAFDRRGQGSIVTKQRGRFCCSKDFSKALITEFKEQKLPFKTDYAYGTDSAVFMEVIPEITNISSSGTYEHTFMETTDISYVEKIAKASCNIKWDELPTKRVPMTPEDEYIYNCGLPVPNIEATCDYDDNLNKKSKILFDKICTILSVKGFICINYDRFKCGKKMIFSQFVKNNEILITVNNDQQFITESTFLKNISHTLDELIEELNIKTYDYLKGIIGSIIKKMDDNYIISKDDVKNILLDYPLSSLYNMTFDIFHQNISISEYSEYFTFRDNEIIVDIRAGQHTSIKRQEEQLKKSK